MFKVGDIVRVRKGLKGDKGYGGIMFQSHMEHLCGEKMEVKTIISGDYICYSDKFKETRCLSLEMLEEKPVPKAKEYSLIVTDKKVIILDKENKKKGISTCHEEDTFDMQVGFELAWDRLHGIDEIPKPVEYKLYDCNGVELKEGDKVKCICLYDGDVFKNTIRKGVNGVLYNDGMSSAHRADKNGGMWDRTKSQYNWHIVKF